MEHISTVMTADGATDRVAATVTNVMTTIVESENGARNASASDVGWRVSARHAPYHRVIASMPNVPSGPSFPAVPLGPRAYRTSLRSAGPILATLPAGALAAASWLLLHNNDSTVRGVVGFLFAVFAAPLLLVAGAPLRAGTTTYWIAVAASLAMWLVVGAAAARRATRRPVASWRDYWREFFWLAGSIWVGAIVALIVANLILGRAFL